MRPPSAPIADPSSSPGLGLFLPRDYRGPVTLPGNGRTIWWTGRVAIGLRHQAPQYGAGTSRSSAWIQSLLLSPSAPA